MTRQIEGTSVIVTGGARGIGRATVERLARAGATVAVGDLDPDLLDDLTAELGPRVVAAHLDVTDPASWRTFLESVADLGPWDVLVNNAGIMPLSPFAALKVEEWDRMIDVNVRGVLHGIAAALPRMKARGEGHFVNISSIGGYRVWPTCGVYSATKFAVRAISDGLRMENEDIRVTVVSPGMVESELAHTITDPGAAAAMVDFRAVALTPDAIARAIAYAVEQPADVDVNELVVRPVRSVE